MLNELISKRYAANGKESFDLTPIQIAARDKISEKLHNFTYTVEVVNCPLCGGKNSRGLSEKDTYGLPVRVVVCTDCGLVYNNPRLSQACMSAFYNDHYRELDRVLPNIESYFQLENKKGERIHQFLVQNNLTSHFKDKLIVDIGCGAGGVLGYFKNEGYDVLGCDLVPAHLEYGIKDKQLDLHYGSLSQITEIVAERQADIGLIIYEQVFEHLPNPRAELKALHKLMGPESLLFIGVPGLRNIDEHYNSDFLRFLQLPHLVHFDLDHLVALTTTNGFRYLAGNEIAQAVFVKATKMEVRNLPDYQATATFLSGLENRWRKKKRASWLPLLPHRLAKSLKKGIENAYLPIGIKNGTIGFLQKIKHFIKM